MGTERGGTMSQRDDAETLSLLQGMSLADWRPTDKLAMLEIAIRARAEAASLREQLAAAQAKFDSLRGDSPRPGYSHSRCLDEIVKLDSIVAALRAELDERTRERDEAREQLLKNIFGEDAHKAELADKLTHALTERDRLRAALDLERSDFDKIVGSLNRKAWPDTTREIRIATVVREIFKERQARAALAGNEGAGE